MHVVTFHVRIITFWWLFLVLKEGFKLSPSPWETTPEAVVHPCLLVDSTCVHISLYVLMWLGANGAVSQLNLTTSVTEFNSVYGQKASYFFWVELARFGLVVITAIMTAIFRNWISLCECTKTSTTSAVLSIHTLAIAGLVRPLAPVVSLAFVFHGALAILVDGMHLDLKASKVLSLLDWTLIRWVTTAYWSTVAWRWEIPISEPWIDWWKTVIAQELSGLKHF